MQPRRRTQELLVAREMMGNSEDRKPVWKGASNVAPKRRIRPTAKRSWICKCQVWHPGYVYNCTKCESTRDGVAT